MLKMALRCPECNRICLQVAFYEEHLKVHALQKAESEELMVTENAPANAHRDTFVDVGTKTTDFPVTKAEPQETERDPLAVDPEEMKLAAQPEEQTDFPVTETEFPETETEPQEMETDPLAVDPEETRLAEQTAPIAAAAATVHATIPAAALAAYAAVPAAAAAAAPAVIIPPDVEIIDVIGYARTCDDVDDDDDDESFLCVHCGKRFSSYPKYLTHLFGHSEELKCHKCKENFSNAGEFEVHMIRHTLSKNKSLKRFNYCTKCGASFFSQKVFGQHCSSAHSNDDVLNCHMCKDEFSSISRYQYHVLKHIGKPMYMCHKDCGFVFGDAVSFRKHTSFHKASGTGNVGEMTLHQCYICALCYFDHLSVLEHRHKAHRCQKPYYCKKCDEVYYVKKLYESHSCFQEKV